MMDKKLKPGYQSLKDLWTVKESRIRRYMDNHVIPFMLPGISKCGKYLDVGEANPRMEYMKGRLGIEVDQFAPPDLNFCMATKTDYYNAIFALDVLEHLQNCLLTVRELKKMLKKDGSLYVNLPENACWLWGDEHFFEYRKDHFIKWVIIPNGLRVERQKKIIFVANWKAFFIGIRPLMRIFLGISTWRSMARSMFCWNFRIYEIKKDE